MQGDEQDESKLRSELYQMAESLDDLLTQICSCCTALVSFAAMREQNLSMTENIYYESSSLVMVDDMRLSLPVAMNILPKIQKELIAMQEKATDEATRDNERRNTKEQAG